VDGDPADDLAARAITGLAHPAFTLGALVPHLEQRFAARRRIDRR